MGSVRFLISSFTCTIIERCQAEPGPPSDRGLSIVGQLLHNSDTISLNIGYVAAIASMFSALSLNDIGCKVAIGQCEKNVEIPLFGLFIRVVFMHGILQDFRNVLRQLPKDPVFASVAILTLGLAVGANTPIFSIIQTILLNSLPYRDVHRLVMIWSQLV